MILQQLEIHNIASIENANIDFEAQPLADSEVFLITGKTGAGKSTILDAICLALYANTPRLDNTLMQGETKDQEKEIKIKDPVQLMRRNTGDAHVALTFTGSNGTHYEAIWSVARARNKVTGKIQGKKWSLHNLDTDFTYTKDKEIREEIARAIGLDFKQFCRTTLLAQGEFTRFLNSKDDEKAEILEKITGVDAYSKIGKKIWDKTAEMHRAWDESKLGIEGIQVMSDETVANKQEELKQLDEQLAGLKAETDKTTKALNWLQDIQTYSANIQAQEETMTRLASEFHRLDGGLVYEKHRQSVLAKLIKENDDFLKGEASKLKIYENVQTIIGYMRNVTKSRDLIKSTQKDIAETSKQLTDVLKPQLAREQQLLKEKQQQLEVFCQGMKKEEAALDALNLPAIRQQAQNLRTLLNDMATAKTLMGFCNQEKLRQDQVLANLTNLQASIEEKQKQANLMVQQVHDAEIKKDTLKAAYEKQRESINKWAKSIRTNLHIGDICPVCQQKVTSTLPHEEAIDALVSEAATLAKEAEKEYEKLANTKNALDADIKALQANLKKDSLTYEKGKEDLEKSIQKAQNALHKVADGCHAAAIPPFKGHDLTESEQQANKLLNDLTTQISAAEVKEKEVKALQAKAENMRNDYELQKDRTLKAQKDYDNCCTEIEYYQKNLQTCTAEEEKNVKLVSEYITLPTSGNIMDYAVELFNAANNYSDQKEKQQELQAKYDQYVLSNGNLSAGLQAIEELMPTWKEERYTHVEELDFEVITNLWVGNLQAEITKLHGAVASALSQVKTSKENLAKSQQLLDDFVKALGEDAEKIQAESFASSLQEKLTEMEASQKELSDNRGGIIRDLQIDRENKKKMGTLIAESEKKKAEYEKWSRLNQLLGDAQGNRFRRIAQSYVLASLIHSANAYMRTLTDRYILKVVPGSFVITMEDAYQGYASRAASTLSGGESFLVSLSLALALSDIGNQLSVDTLFIDEGFGTLSGEPLQHAINTLRSLHNKSGRHVGIISHVEELKERIPVQIRVNQEGNNSSSTIEVVG